MQIRTLGLSPKLVAPIVTALSAVVLSWITTGVLDRAELGVLAVALIGAVAAYIAPAGEVAADLEPLALDDPLTPEEEAELEAIEDPRGPAA